MLYLWTLVEDSIISSKSQLILLELFKREEEVIKTTLLSVIPNTYSLDKHLKFLEGTGLIRIREEKIIRRTFYVSLTEKGKLVAKQLKRAEEVALASYALDEGEGKIEISIRAAEEWALRFSEATKKLSLLYHVNVYGDHVTIAENTDGQTRITNVFVRLNGNGRLRLFCELDRSFECVHVQFAWTLPEVQQMFANNVRNGKVRG